MIELRNVTKTFKSANRTVHAADDISFKVNDGEIFGLIGFSGAGKSTAVRCINLLERPDCGQVLLDGVDLMTLKGRKLREQRRKIGMIFQQFNLFASRTVKENIIFPMKGRGYSKGEMEAKAKELLELVDTLNADDKVNGILVQLPLPKHLNEEKVNERISPMKDVDAFHAANVGKIMIGNYAFLPCTPAGCMELIHSAGIDVSGKECVVIGRSNIVGKPMAMLLLHENGTVTVCHSRTKDLKEVCRRADILVAAVGRAGFVTADMVKDGAVVIDVGINRNADGKLCGDVAYDEVAEKASFITPVPGGVGPMTIAMLMKNTVMAKRIQSK